MEIKKLEKRKENAEKIVELQKERSTNQGNKKDCTFWMGGFCQKDNCMFKHEDENKGNISRKRTNSNPNEEQDLKRRRESDKDDRVSKLMESFLEKAIGVSDLRPNPMGQTSTWGQTAQTSGWGSQMTPQLWANMQAQHDASGREEIWWQQFQNQEGFF